MGYRYTESDPDVWINMATTDKCTAYYKYMLVYVDDVLHLAKDAQEDILKLNQVYLIKDGFGQPDIYLGANVNKVKLKDGRTILYMNCVEYLQGSIKNKYSILEDNKAALKSFGDENYPYPSSYRTWLDVTNELYE